MHPPYPDKTDSLERRSAVGAGYTEHAPPPELAVSMQLLSVP